MGDFRCFFFHRDLLPDGGRAVYDAVRDALISLDKQTEVQCNGTENAEYYLGIMRGVMNDDPLIFWMEDKITVQIRGDRAVLGFDHNGLELSRNNLRERLRKVVERVDRTVICGCTDQAEISERLHDYLLRTVKYSEEDPLNSHNLLGPLLYGKGVCNGIQDAYSYLMNCFGVECTVVYGHTTESTVGHGWNISRIDGRYYHTDVTQDLNESRRYLNNNDEMMSADHKYRRYVEQDSLEANWFQRRDLLLHSAWDIHRQIRYARINNLDTVELYSIKKLNPLVMRVLFGLYRQKLCGYWQSEEENYQIFRLRRHQIKVSRQIFQ